MPTKVHLVKAMVLLVVMYGCESWTIRKAESLRTDAFDCGVKDSLFSFGLQGDPTSPSYRSSVLRVHWKEWYWSWNCNTLATWCEELTHWKRPWCWERLRAEGEGDNRGWDGWMASPTPRVHPNPYPSSRWCHPIISSSVVLSCPQSFPASGSFQMSQLFTSGGQSISVSASTSVLPMNTQNWSPLGWTGWISL